MSDPDRRANRAETEAAAWHGRLAGRVVATGTIESFFAWRSDPTNAEAYRRIEAVWGRAAALSGDPDILAAVTAAGRRKDRPLERSSAARWALGAVCAILVATVTATIWFGRAPVFATTVGEDRFVRLDEGSTVRLDTASRIRVRFDGHRRLIDLEEGRALFNVAHEPRPFVVRAGDTEVLAVGTIFDVRRDGDAVSVVLVSGRVDVTAEEGAAGRQPLRLTAGQRADVADGRAIAATADTAAATGWAHGRLAFMDTPLREAVSEVNRYLPQPIELAAPQLAEVPVTGVFVAGDREAFVSAAVGLFDLRREPGPGGSVRLVADK